MVSFLMKCPQCVAMIPKGGPCPDCHWSEKHEGDVPTDQGTMLEFARRQKIHTRNYGVFMMLTLGTGLIGLLTAIMWIFVIYNGSLIAFFLVALFTVLTGVLSVVLAMSRKLFPVNLNCPSCDIGLEELMMSGDHCPSCDVQLKPTADQSPELMASAR